MSKKKNYKKIYLVGNKSFLQRNLYEKFKNKKCFIKITFDKIFNKKLSKNDLVVNFSNHINFYKKSYIKKFDRNLILAKFLKSTKTKFIMISTRQVYKPKMNLNEKSKIEPISIYGQNSYLSELNCKKILKSNILILRLTNIIGNDSKKKKRPSLMGMIIDGYKKRVIEFDNNYFLKKDLLPINNFSEILFKVIKHNLNGIYNVGSGKPIRINLFMNQILSKRKVEIKIINKIKFNDKDFSINPRKLFGVIKYNFTKKMLINEINSLKKLF